MRIVAEFASVESPGHETALLSTEGMALLSIYKDADWSVTWNIALVHLHVNTNYRSHVR